MPGTPKLSDLQWVVLAHAAKRDDCHVLPLPAAITDDERTRSQITDLIKRKLVAEVAVGPRAPHWREEGDQRFGLMVTAAGCAAIGIDLSDGAEDRPCVQHETAVAAPPSGSGADSTSMPRPSKRAGVIALLSRADGATLAELCEQTGWLAHSARAFLTGLRKSGHRVERTRAESVTRYALVETADAER